MTYCHGEDDDERRPDDRVGNVWGDVGPTYTMQVSNVTKQQSWLLGSAGADSGYAHTFNSNTSHIFVCKSM